MAALRWIIQEPGYPEQSHLAEAARDRDFTVQPLCRKVVAQLSAQIHGGPGILREREPSSKELPLVGIARSQGRVGVVEEAEHGAVGQAGADQESRKAGDLPLRLVA